MANDAMRAFAVGEAVKLAGPGGSVEIVIATAKKLLAYISSEEPAGKPSAPGAEPPKPTPAAAKPAAPAAKPAAKKTAAKPTPPPAPEEPEGEQSEGTEEIDYTSDAGKEQVGALVAQLIAANRRPEAVKLLADYDSTSVSGVKPGEREAFCNEARELLAAGDITS